MTIVEPGSNQETTLDQLVLASHGQYRTIEERVASVLRSAVAAGIFRPGEHLSQEGLAQLFEVSRMPIRSALRQLDAEGLVELHAHRGATVRALSLEEISDLYEMRILIETFALRKTVAAIDDEQIEELAAIAAELPERADREGWLEARRNFYRTFYSIGNTPRVVSTIMQFRAEVNRYTTGLADIRLHTHDDLLERVRLKDPDLAAAWLESHLREVAGELRRRVSQESIDKKPQPPADEIEKGE